jgi:hypothetical protein
MKGIPNNIQIINKTKLCPKCNLVLPLKTFHKAKRQKNGYQLWCKNCLRKNTNKRYWNGSMDKIKLSVRKTQLKRNYGISLCDYNLMLLNQNFGCKICGKPETQRSNPNGAVDSLRVDHCHKTGMIRGLLCSKCNFGISQFNDDTRLLLEAINYLKRNDK